MESGDDDEIQVSSRSNALHIDGHIVSHKLRNKRSAKNPEGMKGTLTIVDERTANVNDSLDAINETLTRRQHPKTNAPGTKRKRTLSDALKTREDNIPALWQIQSPWRFKICQTT